MREIFSVFVCLLLLLALAVPLAARNYIIDSGTSTPSPPTYTDLQSLRTAISGSLAKGDSIEFKNSDSTLQSEFKLGSNAAITLLNGAESALTISAAPGSTTRFLNADTSATINWGKGLTVQGFRSANNQDGGAVRVIGDLKSDINGITFRDNHAGRHGGALFTENKDWWPREKVFTGNITDSNFIDNSAKQFGGAICIMSLFTGNITESNFTGNNASIYGGAIYASKLFTGDVIRSIFTGNRARLGGGAIYATGGFKGSIVESTFSDNWSGNSGGAVSVLFNYDGSITDSTFTNNRADGLGGAVHMSNNLTGGVIRSIFTENSANSGGALAVSNLQGGIIRSIFTKNTADYFGGAVHMWGNLEGDISDSTFTANTALHAGGAMFTRDNVELSGADVKFMDNHAVGVDSNTYAGRGGAIFHNAGQYSNDQGTKSFSLSAVAGAPIVFSGNTHNPGQAGVTPNSIYFGNSVTVDETDYNKTHDGQVDATFNVADGGAIHLLDPMGSQEDNFTYDPGYGTETLRNLALSIEKTGPGTLVLAGHNHMQSATNWVVSEGAMHLVADANGAPVHIELANTTNAMNVENYASFTLKSGASLLLEPTATPHQISGQSITMEAGSRVGLAGFRYGPTLDSRQYTVLKLNITDASDNSGNSGTFNVTASGNNTFNATGVNNNCSLIATSGTITVGVNNYDYNNLEWRGDELIMNLENPRPDPVLSGVPSITGASHIAVLNPAFNIFSYHAKGLFGNWNNYPYAEEAYSTPLQYAYADNQAVSDAGYVKGGDNQYLNSLWIIPNYVNVNQSGGGNNAGYLLQTPGFALGYDRYLYENAFVGAGVSVSWPDYADGTTDIKANDITFALYGGVKLAYALELDGHLGFGFTRYNQDRQVLSERYSEKYNGNSFFAGLGLGRPFALGNGFSLRPGVAYDFIRLDVDGFDEGAGAYSIKNEDYSQTIHRVKAGLDLSWTEANSGLNIGGEVYYLGVYGDRVAETTAHLVADPVNGFTMTGNGLDRDNLGLGLKVSLPVSERWELGAGYNVLLGADTVSQQGLLSATYKF